jgi:hypothetical protein
MAASPKPVAPVAAAPQSSPAVTFGPEFDLLLACCADLSDRVRSERTDEILRLQVNWSRLIDLAEHHGVIPQLYRRLSTAGGAVPPASLEAIRQHYETNARQALWLTRELLRILEHLESRGIPALPYKGPVLAEVLYDNVALRQFSDLDVLVHAADIARAKAAVAELGYELGIKLTPRQERAYLASGYEYTFDSAHGRNLLEIQWQILPRFYSIDFDVRGFFDRSAVVSMAGRSLRTLRVEDLMLVLCAHAAKHVWTQLSWLCDIAELARLPQLDWDTVQEAAKRLGIERIVAMSFFLANKLLGVRIPTSLQRDKTLDALVNEIVPILTRQTDYNTESIPYFRLMMRLRERWHDRARFLWRLTSTPNIGEWSAIRLPEPLSPLYRVVRIFRLVARLRDS